MITIELLEVLFDAERQRDEAVFAQLFERHIARHDNHRAHAAHADACASAERSVADGRSDW